MINKKFISHGHVDGWFDGHELFKHAIRERIYREGETFRYAEIGVYKGKSLIYATEVAMVKNAYNRPIELVGIDNCDPRFGKCHLQDVAIYFATHGLNEQSEPKITLHQKDRTAFSEYPDTHFDVIYIDAGHTEEDVALDIEAAWPKLKVGGFMLFDDYFPRNEQGDIAWFGTTFKNERQEPQKTATFAYDNGIPWGVDFAVNEFAESKGLTVTTGVNNAIKVAMIQKKEETKEVVKEVKNKKKAFKPCDDCKYDCKNEVECAEYKELEKDQE